MSEVILTDVGKRFGNFVAVENFDLKIEDGEFVVLVGPSGCGKSTTLRMVAGLEPISEGSIKLNGRIVNNLPPKHRNIAMVFQSYALYPHMTVFANMAFGLKMMKVNRSEIRRRVQEVAEVLSISDLLTRKPRELSGGQRQRVAMGRALVRRPKVFLFDEPLSNLDAGLRAQMRVEIKKLHRRIGTTIIYVTHDQVEAMTLADRIVLMHKGCIVQVADPMTMYDRPATKFVAGFIGMPRMNFLRGRLLEDPSGNLEMLVGDGIVLAVPTHKKELYFPLVGREVELGIRAENLTVVGDEDIPPNTVTFDAMIDVVEPMGADGLAFFSVNGAEVAAKCPPDALRLVGKTTRLAADMARAHLIDPDSGRVLSG